MKPKTISYSESKESVNEIGLKSWKKLGMEAEIEEGDILATSVAVLKEYVKGMIVGEEEITSSANWLVPSTPMPAIDLQKEKIEIAIDNCESLYELDLLMGDIAKHQLVPQYLEKKKSLK